MRYINKSQNFKITNTMSNLESSYIKILSVLQLLNPKSNFLNQIRTPKLSDIEVITLILTAEYLNIDSERELFRRLPKRLSECIERSVYHRRKKRLFFYIESLREQMAEQMTQENNTGQALIEGRQTSHGFKIRRHITTKIEFLSVFRFVLAC